MRRARYVIGFALLFWLGAGAVVGLVLALARVSYGDEGDVGFWLHAGILLLALIAGGWFGWIRSAGGTSPTVTVSGGKPDLASDASVQPVATQPQPSLPSQAPQPFQASQPSQARPISDRAKWLIILFGIIMFGIVGLTALDKYDERSCLQNPLAEFRVNAEKCNGFLPW